MTHTPGPWQVDGDTYVTKNSLIIAHCKQHGHTELEQALANARLISSAPDLLSALKGLCADMLRRGVEHTYPAPIAKRRLSGTLLILLKIKLPLSEEWAFVKLKGCNREQ